MTIHHNSELTAMWQDELNRINEQLMLWETYTAFGRKSTALIKLMEIIEWADTSPGCHTCYATDLPTQMMPYLDDDGVEYKALVCVLCLAKEQVKWLTEQIAEATKATSEATPQQ